MKLNELNRKKLVFILAMISLINISFQIQLTNLNLDKKDLPRFKSLKSTSESRVKEENSSNEMIVKV